MRELGTGRAGLLAVLLSALGSAPARATAGGPWHSFQVAGDSYRAVREVLRRHPGETSGQRDPLDELVRLGPGMIPVFYELATGQGLEPLLGDGDFDPERWAVSPEACVGLALGALARLPAAKVVDHLEERVDSGAGHDERLTILHILGGLGSAAGLELVWRLSAELGDSALRYHSVESEVQGALSEILRRDPEALNWVEKRLAKTDPGTRRVLVQALVDTGRPAGARILARLLEQSRDPAERVALLGHLAHLESLFPWLLAGTTAAHLDDLLRSLDPEERARATLLVAEVHDLSLCPNVLELLDDADPRVQRAAGAALESMARLPSRGDARAWNAWFTGEHEWWEVQAEQLSQELVSRRPEDASEALRALSQHPLYRHEVAQRISASLTKEPHPAYLSACLVLETLGSRAALPGLVRALEEGNAQLRSAAWRALRALTGEDLPLRGNAWREAVRE